MVAGGVALALLTFMTWYDNSGIDLTAWDALRRTDVVIFAAALVAAAAGAWLGFGDVGPERRWVALIGAGAGFLAALVVIIRTASPPGEADPQIGIFLALVAAVVAGVGGLLTLRSQ
jgi:drug/metabolite transporter (DMT)-like permease